jgi:hypothetical protein
MQLRSRLAKAVSVATIAGVCGILPVPGARADSAVDADAQAVLGKMSKYLGSLPRFSVAYAAADEVVTTDGQKLQFLHSGEITAQRPDRLFVVRKGAAGTSQVFLGGGKLTLFARDAGAYLQLPAASIDAAIGAVHRLGFDAPGADFLDSKPLDASTMDMTSGTHVGMTFIDGIEVHQLAFRGAEVDWQLWVTAGDKPLPLRYVVTTKSVSGAPQYTLQLRNWNTAPKVEAARFAFVPSRAARQLDPAAVTVNAIGDMTMRKE